MLNKIITFDEPQLEFRYGQQLSDPRIGLSIFGPFDADISTNPQAINYVTIGTEVGLTAFQSWAIKMNTSEVDAPRGNTRLWTPFPGFETAFSTRWNSAPVFEHRLDPSELDDASRKYDKYERAYAVVDKYLEGIKLISKIDEKVNLVVCVVPEQVFKNCRPESTVKEGTGEKVSRRTIDARKSGQIDMFSETNFAPYEYSVDFRRQLKARAMKFGIPIQIVRESTLRLSNDNPQGGRGLTPLSDRLWNLSTALYYKAGGKPWRLVNAREGVCYIGIAFRRAEKGGNPRTACCAAQMFLNDGDGIVFLGEYGPWYSPKDNQFHLSKKAAKNLLQGVLQTYSQLHGKKLREVFIHSRSLISDSEMDGFREGCPKGVNVIGIRVRRDRFGPKLFRDGKMPILRGSFLRINRSSGYLWASGFKTSVGTYDGWETPVPLRIEVQHGDAEIERVAQDILALTKLNYNACRLGESEPVTVGFSDAVGEILISNPTVEDKMHNFKYYI